jgi:ketosteroid isomerase-like protein
VISNQSAISSRRLEIERLQALYRAFNAREIDAVLEHFAPDVVWPNGWEGGWIHGREAVREYWLRQWNAIDPTVEPAGFTLRPDGSLAVIVEQTIRELDGSVIARGRVVHAYRFSDGLVSTMEIEEAP